MSHIFISYSHTDRAYAHQLAEALTARGFAVWYDDRIDYGEDWWREIDQAINDCVAVIVLMSPDAQDSRWVQREIALAEDRDKRLFPLLLAGENWSLFVRTQYVDVREGTLPPAKFFDRIRAHVEQAAPQGTIPRAVPLDAEALVSHLLSRALAISTLRGDDAQVVHSLQHDKRLIWGVGPALRRGSIIAIYVPKSARALPEHVRGAIAYLFSVAEDTQVTHAAIPWNHYVSLHRRIVLGVPLTLEELKSDTVTQYWRLPLGNFRGAGRLKSPLSDVEARVFWQLVLDRNPDPALRRALVDRLLN